MKKIRVVVADDHQAIVAVVSSTLGEDFEIVAAVANGREAMDAVLTLDPDVLITDISMPILSGIQLATRLHEANCRTKVIFLTMHKDTYFIAAALSAGVSGYVTKTLLSSDLMDAIQASLKGETFISS